MHSEVRWGPIAEPASNGHRTERVAPTRLRILGIGTKSALLEKIYPQKLNSWHDFSVYSLGTLSPAFGLYYSRQRRGLS